VGKKKGGTRGKILVWAFTAATGISGGRAAHDGGGGLYRDPIHKKGVVKRRFKEERGGKEYANRKTVYCRRKQKKRVSGGGNAQVLGNHGQKKK